MTPEKEKPSSFLSFLYKKIIGDDIDTIKYIIRQRKAGKPILDPDKKKLFIQSLKDAPKDILKNSWIWVLVIIFACCMGYLVGLEKAEIACNNFINENYVNPQIEKINNPLYDPNFLGNYSLSDSDNPVINSGGT